MNPRSFELGVVACLQTRHITYATQLISYQNFPEQTVSDIPYLSPTLTAKSCISFLKSCKSIYQLKQIQAQIFRLGLHQNPNVLDKVVVFCTDPSLGDLLYAEKITSFASKPTLLAYNLLIKALTKKGSYQKAVSLFQKLRRDGILLLPDNFTYPFVFKAFGALGWFRGGSGAHGHVIKSGLEFDTYVCNSLIDMYSLLGRVENMRKVFDEMPERDLVSWNVLISGYVRCEKFEDGVNIFKRMRMESGLKPDEATVVSTLSACTAMKMLELGKEIHHYIDENLVRTPIISNALLDMYSKCGQVSTARRLFDEMPVKNVICRTSMITGYINAGKLDEARYLFDTSPVKDLILWTAMMNGYVQFSCFDEAVDLFRNMQKQRIKPDKFTVVSLLTGCAQSGALEQGKWIHGYLHDNNIKVDTVVGTALIDMYAKCGCIDRALDIFHGLREKDTTSWTTIICGLATNGKTIEALELFSEMRKSGFIPDDITFIGVFSACSHGGLVDEGRKFFHLMTKTYNIQPKLEHYGCLVDLLGRGGLLYEAEELIKDLPDENTQIVIPLYSALLSACRLHGNVKMGERMAEKLEAMESNDSSVHTLLANIYAFVNRWEDVMKVRKKMKDLGVRKVPGCSSVEVDGVIHEFIVRDPSHPEMDEISAMLDSLGDVLMGLKLPSSKDEVAFE